jgi:formylglycine-generating enzyme
VKQWALENNKKQTPDMEKKGTARLVLTNQLKQLAIIKPEPNKVNPQDGAEMIFIPAGKFVIGNNAYSSEAPHREVTLSNYYIYKTPVTVAQYEKFCRDTNRDMPPAPEFNPNWQHKKHPIVRVSWDSAMAYCEWASRGGVVVTLPTEAQWEKAARGTDGQKYPWGNEFDLSKLWCSKSQPGDAGGTAALDRAIAISASPYGVLDMVGNVYQWCLDYYDEEFYQSRLADAMNPVNLTVGEQKLRVLRGGSWYDHVPDSFRCSNRNKYFPNGGRNDYGFRCVTRVE